MTDSFKMPSLPKQAMYGVMANAGKPVSGARTTATSAKEGRLIVDAGMKTKKRAIAKAAIKNLC